MTREPLHLRTISPDRPFDENMRICDAVMDYVEAQAEIRGHNTPEELEMLVDMQTRLREILKNVTANEKNIRSAMLDESEM